MKISLSYKFWLYYCAVLGALLVVAGFFITNSSPNLAVANWLFVPVVIFFFLAVYQFRRHNNSAEPNIASSRYGFILLIYSLILCTIISLGGFITNRSTQELLSNIIFLPMTIFCWYVFYTRPKNRKNSSDKIDNIQHPHVPGGSQNLPAGNGQFTSDRMKK